MNSVKPTYSYPITHEIKLTTQPTYKDLLQSSSSTHFWVKSLIREIQSKDSVDVIKNLEVLLMAAIEYNDQ